MDAQTTHIPHPDDALWIVTDSAVRKPGVGVALYISRNNKLILSGFSVPNYASASQLGYLVKLKLYLSA